MFSFRYLHTITKSYDGIKKGSSTLWGCRMIKAYGALPIKEEHDLNFKNITFDYSSRQIATARKFRSGFYQRLLKPEDIKHALYYCPVPVDMEIFSCIYDDIDGEISLPDPAEDTKEETAHSVLVLAQEGEGFIVDTNWRNWGNNGLGYVSLDYLKKYFITAFADDAFVEFTKRTYLERKKIKVNNLKYSFSLYREGSFSGDKQTIFNIEIFDAGGIFAGWIHFATHDNVVEILDIFILKEYRRRGLGTFLLNQIIFYSKCNKITGFISGFDLLNNRDEVVKSFLIKNNLTVVVDRSRFKDCKNRIVNIESVA